MTDQELLELAAKAEVHRVEFDEISGLSWFDDKYSGLMWNPLHVDGDALRLASHLGISIDWFEDLQFVSAYRGEISENIGWIDDQERSGALRKAITIVASEIGRAMP